MQIADVKQALGSVRRMCEAGNRVAFDEEGGYIENNGTGERATLVKGRGSYVLSLWVPKDHKSSLFQGREERHEEPEPCKARSIGNGE